MHKAAVSAEQKANIASQVFMEEEQKVADLKKIISRTREFNFRKIEVSFMILRVVLFFTLVI